MIIGSVKKVPHQDVQWLLVLMLMLMLMLMLIQYRSNAIELVMSQTEAKFSNSRCGGEGVIVSCHYEKTERSAR